MRLLATIVAVLSLIAAAPIIADAPGQEVFVKARLLSLERQPGCGWLWFGTPATYEVIAGPAELVGKQIHVLVDCVEMPRNDMAADRGDLQVFEIGATHFLALTKDNVGRIEVPSASPSEGTWFYLRAASLHELRPNTRACVSPRDSRWW